ncbi:TPA: PrsW family intramembrane metalloprotease [Staphylococcus aureus]|nr:PrsW family intramembrane metalloprotease [Staphylococcus aureus]HBC4317716.1 PrsW family intramembrane metalloprotease [Staphylococcus aureus]HDZ6036534.1 PrsW family intramembrane metalloprotease [Staphylococcus aureus]
MSSAITQSTKTSDIHNESIDKQMDDKAYETAQNTDLKHEARSLFDNATKSIGRLAGNDESLNLNLKDMFSEVFKPHTKNEADEIFIAGTAKTTPEICDISEEWGKPWLFSRVFIAFTVTFIGLWVMAAFFNNTNAIPGLIFIGALTVPLSGLFFFYESNAFKNISIFEVIIMFFIGGVFSLLSTMVLYRFVVFSDQFERFGSLTFFDAFLVGLVEETGKALIIVYFVNKLKTNKILNGLLIGAAIGAGFAVFESAGYILNFALGENVPLLDIVFTRAWTAIGGHLVWSAIVGAAIVIAKEQHGFEFKDILDKRFLIFFLSAVGLHGIWDTSLTILGSDTLKIFILIVVVWILVFILMGAGLKQVNLLQKEFKDQQKKVDE